MKNPTIRICVLVSILMLIIAWLSIDEELGEDVKVWLVETPLSNDDQITIDLYRRFDETPRSININKPLDLRLDLKLKRKFAEQFCFFLNYTCAVIILTDKQRIEPSIANNPAYWEAYWTAFRRGAPLFDMKKQLLVGTELLHAANNIYIRSLLDHGVISTDELIENLTLARKGSIESESFWGRTNMIAVRGIHLAALNRTLELGGLNTLTLAHDPRLVALLEPLSSDELSLRPVFKSSLNYTYTIFKDNDSEGKHTEPNVPKPNAWFNQTYLVHSHLADVSELSWEKYWELGDDSYVFLHWNTFNTQLKYVKLTQKTNFIQNIFANTFYNMLT